MNQSDDWLIRVLDHSNKKKRPVSVLWFDFAIDKESYLPTDFPADESSRDYKLTINNLVIVCFPYPL